jgi:uncharacterized protein (UPF0332 family)
MAESQDNSLEWFLQKAEEYISSASLNFENKRFFPAAEEIFKCFETLLECLLYFHGIKRIEFGAPAKKYSGRLALQFLVRDNLIHAGRVSQKTYNYYLEMASELHGGGYSVGKHFNSKTIQNYLEIAEDFLIEVKEKAKSGKP